MKSRRAASVRNHLSAIAANLSQKGTTTAEVVKLLRKKHPTAIQADIEDIIEIGLMKLASEVCGRQSGAFSTVQLEMFEEYRIQKILSLKVEDSKGIRWVYKAVGAMTLDEVSEHISEHAKPRIRSNEKIKELARLVEELKEFSVSEVSTVLECWIASRAGK